MAKKDIAPKWKKGQTAPEFGRDLMKWFARNEYPKAQFHVCDPNRPCNCSKSTLKGVT